jgi:hypothetical protein
LATIVDLIRKDARVAALNLSIDTIAWPESALLRQVMGDAAHKGDWIKRIHYASRVFAFALPHLPDSGVLKSRLATLWAWVQGNE